MSTCYAEVVHSCSFKLGTGPKAYLLGVPCQLWVVVSDKLLPTALQSWLLELLASSMVGGTYGLWALH